MNHHLNPKLTGTRYHTFKLLRKALEYSIAKYFSKIDKLENVLDYGCGIKPYESLFLPFFNHYLGADIAETKGADILIDENGDMAIGDELIDVVISTQVLEHVVDVDKYLKEAYRVTKKGGMLLLSTHGYWIYHPNPTDLWRWTRDGLELTLDRNGFKSVESLGFINRAASGLQLIQDAFQWKFPRFFFRPLWALFILGLQKLVDRGSLYNQDAGIFLIIAKKV